MIAETDRRRLLPGFGVMSPECLAEQPFERKRGRHGVGSQLGGHWPREMVAGSLPGASGRGEHLSMKGASGRT